MKYSVHVLSVCDDDFAYQGLSSCKEKTVIVKRSILIQVIGGQFMSTSRQFLYIA